MACVVLDVHIFFVINIRTGFGPVFVSSFYDFLRGFHPSHWVCFLVTKTYIQYLKQKTTPAGRASRTTWDYHAILCILPLEVEPSKRLPSCPLAALFRSFRAVPPPPLAFRFSRRARIRRSIKSPNSFSKYP